MRAVFHWSLGARALELGKRTLIMGIVNVTPDSFSDGGLYLDSGTAVEHAVRMLDEGADIIDVGGESTRPGVKVGAAGNPQAPAEPNQNAVGAKLAVTAEQELRRILPVISALKKQRPQAVVSVDTYKSGVARAAVEAGAEIVNDVSGFRWDRLMGKKVGELKGGALLLHMRGRPEERRRLPPPRDRVALGK